jgi:hypothetical protein
MGEAGKYKQRRVGIVPHFRALFSGYYVLRTTHDIVVAQLPLGCKNILFTWF